MNALSCARPARALAQSAQVHRGALSPRAGAGRQPLSRGGATLSPKHSKVSGYRATAATEAATEGATAEPTVLGFGSSTLQGARDTMEDEVDVREGGPHGFLYAAVFDGHGGDAAGLWLKEHMFGIIQRTLEDGAAAGGEESQDDAATIDFTGLLTSSFTETDAALLQHLTGGEEKNPAGATATVGLIRKDKLIIANIGDSRAILSRRGSPVDLSCEHRVSGSGKKVKDEIERVKATGGWVDDGRVCSMLAVSRSFGDYEFKGEGLSKMLEGGVQKKFFSQEHADAASFSSDPVIVTPDVNEMALTADDEFVVIASDGLWDVMTSAEANRFVRNKFKKGEDAQSVADDLTEIALKRYSSDNIGVIVVDLLGSDGWNPSTQPAAKKKKKMFGLF